jgi:CheY-like chemotaxis protein
MLTSLGYRAKIATDGNDALQLMSHESFDLVLMDCHMPGMDGYEATTEIRRQESNSFPTQRIPILAVTADFLQSNRQRCLDCGMDDYLTKPFTQEQLGRMLTRWLVDSTSDDSTETGLTTNGCGNREDAPASASINRQALEEIRQLDPDKGDEILREIVVAFCASSTNLILQLRSAVFEGDTSNIEHIAHSLKGASAQIGAVVLASLCENIIFDAKKDDISNAQTLLEQSAVEHVAVIAALDQEVQSAVS